MMTVQGEVDASFAVSAPPVVPGVCACLCVDYVCAVIFSVCLEQYKINANN